jgi:acetyl esterase/lipase
MDGTTTIDWDDAYANGPHIAGGADYPARWQAEAAAWREAMRQTGGLREDLAYGAGARARFDLFLPAAPPRGLMVFVHGGFWMRLDKSSWSHLARGALLRGFAVAVPSYDLCPQVRIAEITRQVAAAIEAAAHEVAGPIHLAGHSAGGHLVTQTLVTATPLAPALWPRLRKVVSISGLHDLRPLMRTAMNATLRLDLDEARAQSAALQEPRPGVDLTCWVGADERPEFVRQNALLANVWRGFDIRVDGVEEPRRHHFDIVAGLADPDHPLTERLLAG